MSNQTAINAIRIISAEAIQKANSGHPGLPMGSAAMAYTLWSDMLHNPQDPKWANRDRFVLSAGHGSMLIYSLLHLFGYPVSMDDIKNFRQMDSLTAGHPEYRHTPGVEITTGPLGQGIANAVGMAIAESYLASKFNKPGFDVVNHRTYALCGDGCMMEGVSGEAASFAGTLKLSKLTVLYDSNNITIEGNTSIAFREDVGARFAAYGWNVINVADGNDTDAILKAINSAKAQNDKPSLIIVHTQIGFGCPAKQGKNSAHGEPLGEDNIAETKKNLNWNYPPFTIPDEAYADARKSVEKSIKAENEWNDMMNKYRSEFPEDYEKWIKWNNDDFTKELADNEEFSKVDEKAVATRASSELYLNRAAAVVENIIGGSADLAPSNKSYMKGRGDFCTESREGANLHFGVREHAMGAICNGIAVHGGLRPYCATFFVFSDYMKHAIRLAALMKLPVTYIFTHDSIGVGEDGPTHQPIEHLAMLRSMPNTIVWRAADSREMMYGWQVSVSSKETPVVLVNTRQNLPLNPGTSSEALHGAYIVKDSKKAIPDAIIIATGSELEIAYKAAEVLEGEGKDIRVVSMPSMDIFEMQSDEYKEKILPIACERRVSVEAAASFGWGKYTGLKGKNISIDTFGASGPAKLLFEKYGFTTENVVNTVKKLF